MPPGIVVRRAMLSDILVLRRDVLRPGLPLDAARFPGDLELDAHHVGAFVHSGQAVGCASLIARAFRQAPAYQLRGMATRPDLTGRGIGSALLSLAAGLRPRDLPLWCNARIEAVAFYRRMGWTVVSEPFEVPGVGPHVAMLAGP